MAAMMPQLLDLNKSHIWPVLLDQFPQPGQTLGDASLVQRPVAECEALRILAARAELEPPQRRDADVALSCPLDQGFDIERTLRQCRQVQAHRRRHRPQPFGKAFVQAVEEDSSTS